MKENKIIFYENFFRVRVSLNITRIAALTFPWTFHWPNLWHCKLQVLNPLTLKPGELKKENGDFATYLRKEHVKHQPHYFVVTPYDSIPFGREMSTGDVGVFRFCVQPEEQITKK